MTKMIKRYSGMIRLESFMDRFEYLKIGGSVGEATFGSKRYLNQALYQSDIWRRTRDDVIIRDGGCDLGVEGMDIGGMIYIHHIDPITVEDIVRRRDKVLDPDNLICVSDKTHKAIHYGDKRLLFEMLQKDRSPGDTKLW